MRLDISTGELEIAPSVLIYPGMPRQVFKQQSPTEPEVWITSGEEPVAYRVKVLLSSGKTRQEIILIIFFSLQDNCPLTRWDMQPAGKFDGEQRRPEGKFTERAREWFKKNFDIGLPINRSWGSIDAAYDPHNLTTVINFTPQNGDKSR